MAAALRRALLGSCYGPEFVTRGCNLIFTARNDRLRATLKTCLQPAVLVVDKVGYLSVGHDAANLLFHVVNDRHVRRRSC